MIKIRALFIFVLVPLFAGYVYASSQGHKIQISHVSNYNTFVIPQKDKITLTSQGNIYTLATTGESKIATGHPQLIEVIPLANDYLGVDKQTNYSSLEVFSQAGSIVKTLFNGNTGDIDTMNWYTDPTEQVNQNELAFVSDQDKAVTKVYDNALYVSNLSTGKTTKIVDPISSSGGIAHPVWYPRNQHIILYDNYEYDTNFNPYSIIEAYDLQSQNITDLTTVKENAYQGSFSPNGKQFLFLGRNSENTATLYIADFTGTKLAQVKKLAEGDFAYPEFSYTPNTIYYLQAQGNSSYDLYLAQIKDGKLINPTAITTNAQLLANSGFTVSQIKQ